MVSDSAGEGGRRSGSVSVLSARLCCQGCCLMQGTCATEPSHPLAGGFKGTPPAKQPCGTGARRGREDIPKPGSRLRSRRKVPAHLPGMRCGRPCLRSRKALGSCGTRCPCRCRLPSPALSRNRGVVCWSTQFLLETWKSRWPARASWDALELAARFWRTV